MARVTGCPCGSGNYVDKCCERYILIGEIPPTAETLMRSRYTAYTLGREDYLLATWHTSTRPVELNLANEIATQWLGLKVKQHSYDSSDPTHATVEFIARYKVNGRAHRLHEVSQFVYEDGRWFYVDGAVK